MSKNSGTVNESKRSMETMYQRLLDRNKDTVARMSEGFENIKTAVARGTRSFEREFYSGEEPEEPTDPFSPRAKDPVSR